MKNYYLQVGLRNIAIAGELKEYPTLTLPQEIYLDNIDRITRTDIDRINVEELVKEHKDKLTDYDTLTVRYWNEDAQFILDEWIDEFNVPYYQREEVWGFTGIKETYIHFIDGEEENWQWLVDAQVDYYDDDGNPIPIYPADEEE